MQKSMPFTKLSALLGCSLFFGKVEGILIIPLEKWKFVHELRWKKDVLCLIER